MRAGDEQADLCASCVAIGVWRDDPLAAAFDRLARLTRSTWLSHGGGSDDTVDPYAGVERVFDAVIVVDRST
jgi:hypothetical protein